MSQARHGSDCVRPVCFLVGVVVVVVVRIVKLVG